MFFSRPPRHHDRPPFCYGNGVFKMRTQTFILGRNSPSIGSGFNETAPQTDHGFYSNNDTWPYHPTLKLSIIIIGYAGFFVDAVPHAVADQLFNNTIGALRTDIRFNSAANIGDGIYRPGFPNTN